MNIFSNSCGTNSCFWILILLLVAASSNCNGLEGVLAGTCTPVLIALLYSLWKNGTLARLVNGGGSGCGCGCN